MAAGKPAPLDAFWGCYWHKGACTRTAWQGSRVLLRVPGVINVCSGGPWVALGNWRALERELQISPFKRGKTMLIVRFLVCIQDLRMLECCILTDPVSFIAEKEE